MVTRDVDQLQPNEEEPVKETNEKTTDINNEMTNDVDDDIVEMSIGPGDRKRPIEELKPCIV